MGSTPLQNGMWMYCAPSLVSHRFQACRRRWKKSHSSTYAMLSSYGPSTTQWAVVCGFADDKLFHGYRVSGICKSVVLAPIRTTSARQTSHLVRVLRERLESGHGGDPRGAKTGLGGQAVVAMGPNLFRWRRHEEMTRRRHPSL